MGRTLTPDTEDRYYWVYLNGSWHPGLWRVASRSWHIQSLNGDYAFNDIEALGEQISSDRLTELHSDHMQMNY